MLTPQPRGMMLVMGNKHDYASAQGNDVEKRGIYIYIHASAQGNNLKLGNNYAYYSAQRNDVEKGEYIYSRLSPGEVTVAQQVVH